MQPPKKVTVLQPTFSTETAALSLLQSQFTGTGSHYLMTEKAICQFQGDKIGLINTQLTLPTHILADLSFKTFLQI